MYVLVFIAAQIPAGSFWMGRQSDRPDEGPRHQVTLSAFTLDDTLVSVADFRRFVSDTGYVTTAQRMGYGMVATVGMGEWEWKTVRGISWRKAFDSMRDDFPVTLVSHYDAVAYCRARNMRLPTEAEWEYAMRAGSTSRYPWGDSPKRSGKFALNFWQDPTHAQTDAADGWTYVSPVRAYPPNAWGVYDPVGNVWQLVEDFYGPYTGASVANPTGPSKGEHRVSRGGSWWCSAHTCEGFGLFYRGKALPEAPFNNVGFRCAR